MTPKIEVAKLRDREHTKLLDVDFDNIPFLKLLPSDEEELWLDLVYMPCEKTTHVLSKNFLQSHSQISELIKKHQ